MSAQLGEFLESAARNFALTTCLLAAVVIVVLLRRLESGEASDDVARALRVPSERAADGH
jgi:hypothetical protein